MHKIVIIYFLVVASATFAQKQNAYQIFNAQGKKVSYKKMMKDLLNTEILFFGEEHDNSIAHWLEIEITTAISKSKDDKLTLGFEMFESDQQLLLNDYLMNFIKDRVFIDSCRWSNYQTDYQPLVYFAKNHTLPCVATNIPRKYASLVYKQGKDVLNTLSEDELALMCSKDFTIDTNLTQYKMLAEMGIHGDGDLLSAQAIKDATMAKFIDKYWQSGNYFIHFNGSFHSDFQQGIIWYLQQLHPALNYRTISVVSQDDISDLDNASKNRANYIVCVPSSMTKTH